MAGRASLRPWQSRWTMSSEGTTAAAATTTTPVAVLVELCGALAGPLADERVGHTIEQTLTGEIASLMRHLGVPGSPSVRVEATPESPQSAVATRPFRLTVNGHRCRLPAEDLQRVVAYMRGTTPAPPSHGLAEELLLADAQDGGADSSPERLVEFLRLACAEALGRVPSVLLGDAQCQAYAREVADASPPNTPSLDPARLGQALARVLDLRISIADRVLVASVLRSSRDEQAAAEELIRRLRRRAIELRAPAELLDELLSDPATDFRSLMDLFRASMKDTFGLELPELRLVCAAGLKPRSGTVSGDGLKPHSGIVSGDGLKPHSGIVCADELKPNSVRFVFNDVADLPWVTLRAGTCIAGAEPASLEHFEIAADPILNPVGGTASVISNADARRAEELGVIVGDRATHLLACLAAALRAHAGCLIDRDVAEQALEAFTPSSPALVDAARSAVEPDRLVSLLRRLVADGLSIANLPLVLDLLLEHQAEAGGWPTGTASVAEAISGEDTAPDAEAYVRAGMPRSTLRQWRSLPIRPSCRS